MEQIFTPEFYYTVLITMAVLTLPVFLALTRVTAGYGVAYTRRWGPAVSNRAGWVAMEAPTLIVLGLIWAASPCAAEPAPAVMASIFALHYVQRTLVFPLLMRGRSRMPLAIIAMGAVFNTVNAYLIAGWLFRMAPAGMYPVSWLWSPLFILGTVIFAAGMWVNISSDSIIRHLRRPGMTGHYIPRGGMFRYVTCANYLGEVMEWTGYAILTWSWAGAVFALWTFANLAPRAMRLHKRYETEFGEEYTRLRRRYIIPFIF